MAIDERITLAHGNGGRRTREIIEEIFARHLANPQLDVQVDAATFALDAGHWALTTDGFVVQPLEFPGGSIGSLAINGTVNDLAVSGATAQLMTLNATIEEGLEIAQLDRLIADLARAANAVGARVVAGDTKVVPRGHGGGIYLATTGLGRVERAGLGLDQIRAGDRLLVSGSVGDHGVCVMLAREEFDLRGDVASDCAPVLDLARAAWGLPGVRFLRDPTRGGLATVAHEIAHAAGVTVELEEEAIPVRPETTAVCDMLGFDPYYLACEGRAVAVVTPEAAEELLERWKAVEAGRNASVIGVVEAGPARAVLRTPLGGTRILEELEDDPLPRIC
jgi:hydrogenase expression/formation protein HypE